MKMQNSWYKKGIVLVFMVVFLLTVPSTFATFTPNVVETLNNDNGEDKSSDTIKSFKNSNSEMLDGLPSIIMNDDELSIRIDKLEVMNGELKPVNPLGEPPVICGILELTFIFLVNKFYYYGELYLYYMDKGMEQLALIYYSLYMFFLGACEPIGALMIVLGCEFD